MIERTQFPDDWFTKRERFRLECGDCKTHRFTAPPVRRQRRARNWNRR